MEAWAVAAGGSMRTAKEKEKRILSRGTGSKNSTDGQDQGEKGANKKGKGKRTMEGEKY